MDLERYCEAGVDFEQVARIDPSFVGLASWRRRARRWATRPPMRNHYAVLGVSPEANSAEVRRAYRAAALRWHPDKNPERREEAERRFKEVQEAQEVLMDPQRRAEFEEAEPHPGVGYGQRHSGGFSSRGSAAAAAATSTGRQRAPAADGQGPRASTAPRASTTASAAGAAAGGGATRSAGASRDSSFCSGADSRSSSFGRPPAAGQGGFRRPGSSSTSAGWSGVS